MKKIFTLFVMSLFALSTFAELAYNTTFTQSDFNNSSTTVKKEGTIEWDGDHVRCGGASNGISLGGPSWNWDDKYFDVKLANGVPQTLTFEWACNNVTSTDAYWYVKESANGSTWSAEIWSTTSSNTSWTKVTVDLKPNTRYLRFCFSGNFAGNFRNIKVTEKIVMGSPSQTELDFGTVKVDAAVEAQTFNLDWTNLEATVASDEAHFTVSPATFGEIGAYNQTATIAVGLNTKEAGAYNGTITVEGRGKSAQVTVTAVVEKYNQTIAWNPAEEYNYGDEIPVATATSGLEIAYEISDPSVLVFENGAFSTLHGGDVTVTAKQAGNYKYNAAKNVVKSFTIVPPTTFAQETMTIVYGAQETWNGYDLSTYSVGTHQLVYVTENAQGGVHTITLTLTVTKLPTLNVDVPLAFCEGGSESFHGKEYTEAGEDLIEAEGEIRDTLYQVTVTVHPVYAITEQMTITYGDEATWEGIDLSKEEVGAREIVVELQTIFGCDSVRTLNLTVTKQPTLEVPVALEFCEGGSEFFRGKEYTEAGEDLIAAEGEIRDTLYQVTVTVHPVYAITEQMTITYGDEATWEGIDLSKEEVGSHVIVLDNKTVFGCDSVHTLELTVIKQGTEEIPVGLNICEGDTVELFGKLYFESGTDEFFVEGEISDTLYHITITVNPRYELTEEMTIVYGEEVTWEGRDLSEAPVGEHTLTAYYQTIDGCDSTITLSLTVLKQETVEFEQYLQFCEGDSVEYRDKWYTEAGFDTLSVEGTVSDTMIYVIIEMLPNEYEVITDQVLSGYDIILPEGDWVIGNITVSGSYPTVQSGEESVLTFYQYNQTDEGCESTIELVVTVESNFESVENVFVGEQAHKVILDGMLYIRRGETLYTVEGREVK